MLYLLYFVLFLLLILLVIFSVYQIYTRIIEPGAIYYPSTNSSVTQILKIAEITSKDTLIDLGSGDGKILVATARLGIKAVGYEINPFLVWQSRRLIHREKLDKLATVYWKSFWKADFSQATIITVYLFPNLMDRLQSLLEKKLKHPTKVIINDYPFTKLTPTKHHKQIYLYIFPNSPSDK